MTNFPAYDVEIDLNNWDVLHMGIKTCGNENLTQVKRLRTIVVRVAFSISRAGLLRELNWI